MQHRVAFGGNMNYKTFVEYSISFSSMTLSDIIKLHKDYINVLSAIKYFYKLNSIEDVKLSQISEEQFNNITKKIIF